ncbi:MAG: hypothetical protein ABIP95_11530 [Pelobium sp.]
MNLFGNKRDYRFKTNQPKNEQLLFWGLGILVSLIFMVLYYLQQH